MSGKVWIIINLAVLLSVGLAASTDQSSSTSEVPTRTSSHSSSTVSPMKSTTTTEAPSTTTIRPTTIPTTTKTPETTTNIPSTTTNPPSTTTNPPSTTTNLPSTTTNLPPTTVVPDVEQGTWNVTDGNVTCILANLKIEFTLNIGNEKYDIALSPNSTTTGSTCHASNETQVLELNDKNYILTFEFAKDSDGAFVKNVTFEFMLFEERELFYNDTRLFHVKTGNSYLCLSTETVSMGNATMHIHSIHIQAFGGEGMTDFSTAEECEADDNISDIVPIAVACALAGLIVVVLIAYLVGRRRNRQKGYTSV